MTVEALAHDVAFAPEGLSVEDVRERAGTHADGSYVEPTEAAWDVVEEAMAPFPTDLTRRVELRRRTEAAAICQAVLLALCRISSVGLPPEAAGDARGGSPDPPPSSERRIHPDVTS